MYLCASVHIRELQHFIRHSVFESVLLRFCVSYMGENRDIQKEERKNAKYFYSAKHFQYEEPLKATARTDMYGWDVKIRTAECRFNFIITL